jgi:ferrochelatase
VVLIKDYFAHPSYIQALAESVRRYQAIHGVPEKLLMSFHGIPQPYADRGDPYPERCHATATCLAQALGLADDRWVISFQSRFGRQEWVKPYTNVILKEWGQSGIKTIQIISPAFSADCLETLEELAIENRDVFLEAGGQHYGYIPALNVDDLHIDMMLSLVTPMIDGFAALAKQ